MSTQYNLYLINLSSFHHFFSFNVEWSPNFIGSPKNLTFHSNKLFSTLQDLLYHIDNFNDSLYVLCIQDNLHYCLHDIKQELDKLSLSNQNKIYSSKHTINTFYKQFISKFQIEPIQYFLFLLQTEERKQLVSKKRKLTIDNNNIRKKFKLLSITNG
jgi:hypothetical protein